MNQPSNHNQMKALFVCIIVGFFLIPGYANGITTTPDQQQTPLNNGGRGIIYVDDDNTLGPWDGSIDYPYQFIQDGIDNAADDDTVHVFNGRYVENVVVCKTLSLVGEDKYLTIIDGASFGTVLKICAQAVTVAGFTITNSGNNPSNAGILVHTANNTITQNNIQKNNNYGVSVLEANNTIFHNNFFDNIYHAFDSISGSVWDGGYPIGGNYWDDYTDVDDDEDGIGDTAYPTGNSSTDRYPLMHPYGSVFNTNTSEIFLTIQGAIDDEDTLNGHVIYAKARTYKEHLLVNKSVFIQGQGKESTIIDARNSGDVITIYGNGVTLSGFTIRNSGTATQNAGVLIMAAGCSLVQNIIVDNYHGLMLHNGSMDIMIHRNRIMNNAWNGMTLQSGCTGVVVMENDILGNFYAGIGILGASYNHIYHNTFRTNRYHAFDDATNIWDDGYPSGGNYWDDYTGIDANGDGIGDTPYAIPNGLNLDRYPLMSPYTEEDNIPPIAWIVSPSNGLYIGNMRFFPNLLQQRTILFGDITIEVEAFDAHSGIKKVEFYIDDGMKPVFVDTQSPYSWTWTTRSLLKTRHTIIIVAYDYADNVKVDSLYVRRFF